jgi:hypothetical protein
VKITTVAIFGVGYVLGSKAGRERYAQIVAAARKASERLETYGNGGGRSIGRSGAGSDHGAPGSR